MSKYAKVNKDNEVIEVIVSEKAFIDQFSNPQEYIAVTGQTTSAGIGMVYDVSRGIFRHHKPFESWVLNLTTGEWEPTKKRPEDGKAYKWNEESQEWFELKEGERIQDNEKTRRADQKVHEEKLKYMDRINKSNPKVKLRTVYEIPKKI